MPTKLLAAGKWDFRYTANRILADREEARARTVAAQPWIERGHALLAEEPSARHVDHGWRHLDSLVTDTGEPATVTVHVDTDPARWSIWVTCQRDDLITVKDGGHRIESDSVDWSTQDDPDASPDEGLYHCEQVDIADDWTVDYYTTDADAAALGLRTAAALAATDGAGPDDPQARAARQAQAEADETEAARLERRKVKRLNKLGDAAITTRRQWVTEYLTRKPRPKGHPHGSRSGSASIAQS